MSREAAIALGCDCPLPPPEGVDASYGEASVRDWLDDLDDTCEAFGARETILDCAEFPCLLFVEHRDMAEAMEEPARNALFCGLQGAAPELDYLGTAGTPGSFYNTFSVRPQGLTGYEKREMMRMMSGWAE